MLSRQMDELARLIVLPSTTAQLCVNGEMSVDHFMFGKLGDCHH